MINRLFINSYYYNQQYTCNDCKKVETGTNVYNGGVHIKDVNDKFTDLIGWGLVPDHMPNSWTFTINCNGYAYHCGCDPKQKGKGKDKGETV